MWLEALCCVLSENSEDMLETKMSEVYSYHYTNQVAAWYILRKGEILPSDAANGDAVHGDGVYLTTLDPRQGESTIKNNNWDGAAAGAEKKTEVYFEIMIPYHKVSTADDKRDIKVHKGPLTLVDYKWNLKNWDGDLLVTQYFMVTSDGRATEKLGGCMGRYTLVQNIVMNHSGRNVTTPVFKKDERHFLYLCCTGKWCVSDTVGKKSCFLVQKKDDGVGFPLLPSKTLPWSYSSSSTDGSCRWLEDDNTLKVFPCYR